MRFLNGSKVLFIALFVGSLFFSHSASAFQHLESDTTESKIDNDVVYVPVVTSVKGPVAEKELSASATAGDMISRVLKRVLNDVAFKGSGLPFPTGQKVFACGGASFSDYDNYSAQTGMSYGAADEMYTLGVASSCVLSYTANEIISDTIGTDNLYPAVGRRFVGLRWKLKY